MKEKKNNKYLFGKILIFTVIVISLFSIYRNFERINENKARLEALKIEENNLRIKNEELKNDLDTPIDDEYVAKIAREKLDYRKYGIIYYNDMYNN